MYCSKLGLWISTKTSLGQQHTNTYTPLTLPCPIPLTPQFHPQWLSGRQIRLYSLSSLWGIERDRMSQLTPKTSLAKRMAHAQSNVTKVWIHTFKCTLSFSLTHTHMLGCSGICDSARPTGAQNSEDGWYQLTTLHTAKNVWSNSLTPFPKFS